VRGGEDLKMWKSVGQKTLELPLPDWVQMEVDFVD
jgi:hypothetical protein